MHTPTETAHAPGAVIYTLSRSGLIVYVKEGS